MRHTVSNTSRGNVTHKRYVLSTSRIERGREEITKVQDLLRKDLGNWRVDEHLLFLESILSC